MASKSLLMFILLPLALLAMLGCEAYPPDDILRSEVSELLNQEFRKDLFEVASLRRQGNSKHSVKETGDRLMTVYFNVKLRLREDFDLTRWDGLNSASLAYLLGATEKGIEGVSPGGNTAGDLLRIRGSRVYALRQGHWRALSAPTRMAHAGDNTIETRRLIARINELAERLSVRHDETERTFIDKELNESIRRIERQLDQQAQILSAASGPSNGAYWLYMEALEKNSTNVGFAVRNNETQGSVENCQLIQTGGVDIAIVQSNIATLAYTGKGIFREKPAMTSLRALAALFPEYIQIVTAAGSGIDKLDALRGKRIDIGQPSSGSRVDSLRILAAAGLKLTDFAEISESGLNARVSAIKEGRLDAFFTTLQAPGRALQALLASGQAQLLSLPPPVQQNLLDQYEGYRPASLPAHTYPGQMEAISTLGLTAMLIAREDFPEARVEQLLTGLFGSVERFARENLRVTLLSPEKARQDLTIPLHAAAEKYYSRVAPITSAPISGTETAPD